MSGINGHRPGVVPVIGPTASERSQQEARTRRRDHERGMRPDDERRIANRKHIESFLRCFGEGS